jgi:hypothetical protein
MDAETSATAAGRACGAERSPICLADFRPKRVKETVAHRRYVPTMHGGWQRGTMNAVCGNTISNVNCTDRTQSLTHVRAKRNATSTHTQRAGARTSWEPGSKRFRIILISYVIHHFEAKMSNT